MSLENLRGFLARVGSAEEQALAEEFKDIRTQVAAFRQDNDLTTEVGGNKENIKKNRYKDILPYDQTRVPLSLVVEDGQNDYINASFIKGLDNKQCYIATQGPLSHTVVDFWRMIWEYRVKVVVMACREVELGKKKCERYWPTDQEPSSFGPFSVTMVEKKMPNTEVVLRKLQVTFQREVREIMHFQYVAWPDRGIPDTYDCFLEMIRLLRQYQGEDPAPMCVHCSAGCGRTGVICTVEYVQNLISKKRVPDNFSVFEVVVGLRQQRPSAVQTKEQYEFVYHAVAEMFKKELKSRTVHCYENVSRTESKSAQLYDDVGSLKAELRTLPPAKRGSYSRSTSVPADQTAQPVGERAPRLSKDMSETYAVVNKARTAPPRVGSSPETRRPPPPATHYDNIRPLSSPGGPSAAPVYSTVRPKSKVSASPTLEGQTLNGSWAAPPSYSLAGAPTIQEKPQENNYATLYIRGAETEERGSHSGSRLSDVPSSWSERVDPSAASPQGSASKGNNKFLNFLHAGFIPAPPKKGSLSTSESIDSYEDIPDPSRCASANQSLTNGLGFNQRIGRPKGPRDPPAEWSRLER
ncbi:tyrosine-protein phosphatase non-receptor type 18 [Lissotriton helveticus]